MTSASVKPVIGELESLFSKFNEKFYNNELQTPRYHGKPGHNKRCLWVVYRLEGVEHWRTEKVADLAALTKEALEAMKKDDGFYEINICAEHLARPFEQVAETLLHEMVHLYNLQIGGSGHKQGAAHTTIRNIKKRLNSTA